MFKIIEDASPYYITFTYEGLPTYIKSLQNIANSNTFNPSNNNTVNKIRKILPSYLTEECYIKNTDHLNLIAENNPCFSLLDLEKNVVFLTTLPKTKSIVHYDIAGAYQVPVKVRINYPVFVHDDKCTTNWFSGTDIVKYNEVPGTIIEKRSNLKLVKSTHLCQDHAMLINTSIYHNWDNSQSMNKRTILGIRSSINSIDFSFEDFRKILFGI
jgi:hypothetical protein